MRVSVGCQVIFSHIKVGFRCSLIRFLKKVSMTKTSIDSKDVELNIDEGFSWCHVISRHIKVVFRCFLIGFYKQA